jgi:hypothetical protein
MKIRNQFGFHHGKVFLTHLLAITGLIMILAVSHAESASQASLVQIIDTSQFSPPSPDPAGIVYLGTSGTFMVSDSEVNEMSIFTGDNLFEMTPDGFLSDTLTTTSFSREPTGVAFNPANGHLFFSDDNARTIFEVDPGPDGLYDTSDDIVTSFDTAVLNSDDPEGVTFDTWDGVLFIIDGNGSEVYRIDPGVNGIFDGVPPMGDDEMDHFDTLSLGVRDSEGIAFNTDEGTLFVIGEPINLVAEVTVEGNLVRMIDISAAATIMPGGLAYAPSSVNPSEYNLFIADRGVDNNQDSNENDGRIFEVTIPPLDITAPIWNGATIGIGSAIDTAAGGSVRVEFDTASDDEDGANVKFNIYYAETAVWDDADWSKNTVILDVTPTAISSYAYAYTVTGLTVDVDYTFGVRVEDQSGNEDGNITTLTATPTESGGWTELALSPIADASVNSWYPAQNYGTQSNLEVDARPVTRSYLRFDVNGLNGDVVSAHIRLECINPSPVGGSIYAISNNSWQETTVTYANRPAIDGYALDSLGAVSVGDIVELDVTAAISGNGTYNFAMDSNNNNGADYRSREDLTYPPTLFITTNNDGGPANTAPQIDNGPTATPASIFEDETAQLSVQASDADGDLLSYSWTLLPGEGSLSGSGDTVTYIPPAVAQQQSFTVTVTVSDGQGGSVSGTVNVTVVPVGGGGAEITFTPVADAYVNSWYRDQNYGTLPSLDVDARPVKISYLRFDVSGLSGTVVSARLQLQCSNKSPFGGAIYAISNNSWQETTVTYNNRPAIDGSALHALGTVSVGDIVELDVTAAISGNGTYNFAMNSNNKNGADYYSREGSTPPILIITTD